MVIPLTQACRPPPSSDAVPVGPEEKVNIDVTGLKSSRWADSSPEPEPEPKPAKEGSSIRASRWADTPPPEEEDLSVKPVERIDDARQEEQDKSVDQRLDVGKESVSAETKEEPNAALENAVSDVVTPVKTEEVVRKESLEQTVPDVTIETEKTEVSELKNTKEAVPQQSSAPTPQSPTKSRLEAPRLRKKLSWRGRTCIVSIPHFDFEAMGLPKPMSSEEVRAKMKHFEDAGYVTGGFDLAHNEAVDSEVVHAKPIFPDDEQPGSVSDKPYVNLPDLKKWSAYIDHLTEQKLAALGVTLGEEEPTPDPSQEMSRQSSAQYPPLPFSPPLPSVSAASLGRPGLTRGHSATMSVASPIARANSWVSSTIGRRICSKPN